MSAITKDEHTGEHIVTLAGEERGRYSTRLRALRALENGTGYGLGSPEPRGVSSRMNTGHTRAPRTVPDPDLAGSGSGRAVLPWTDVAAFKAGKVDPPESLRQAQRCDSTFARYAGAGLCKRCASRAAWGGRVGFRRVHAPCGDCAPIVADLPGARHVNGWRTLPEMTRDRRRFGDSVAGGASEAPAESPTPAPDTESLPAA